ncbi:MAG: S41 family peptidase, partial [Planctomycetota bacterium]
ADKLSPFTEVACEGETPYVRFAGEWYELLEMDGVAAKKIISFCKKRYGRDWERRFAEDLVEVLEGMGRKAGPTAKLKLKAKGTGKERTVAAAPMTRANREAVWKARRERPAKPERLDPAAAAADMKFLRTFLDEHHSYRLRNPASLDRFVWPAERGAIDANGFALAVSRLVTPFGDGHTRVRGRWSWLPRGYAPFVARVSGKRLVALREDGGALLSKSYPYLRAIDGVDIDKWLAAAGATVAHGSPQFRRWNGAEDLTFINFLRGELQLPLKESVELRLESEDGRRTRKTSLPVAPKPARFPPWPRGKPPLLDGRIGYLRIAAMDGGDRFLAGIEKAMDSFADTRGLIIDVRGNGGGSRDVLRLLLPRFLDKPRVVNAAVYRLPAAERPERPDGHLQNRFLYPLSWTGWNDRQRAVVSRFNREFKPEWEPSIERFSSWHYMLIEPDKKKRYTAPVVILMDGGCFSATDIFLGAFKGVRGVTLLGTPSGGGSGRSRKITLPTSGVRLRVSTMASFQPNGKLYDGNGIVPDVIVDATPADWIGKTDSQLDAAHKRLRR